MNKKNLKLLSKYLAPFYAKIFLMFISLCLTSSSLLAIGKATQYLIDKGLANSNLELLDQSLVIIIVVVMILAIATFSRSYLINSIAEQIIAKIRNDAYSHIINLSPSYFESQKTSDVISRLTSDTTLLSSIIGPAFSFSLRNILMSVGGIILLFLTSPKLTLYTIAIIPVVIFLIISLGKKVKHYSKTSHESVSLLGAHVDETISGIKVVQSNNRTKYEEDNFKNQVTICFISAIKWIKFRAFMVSSVIFVVFFSIVLVLWIGGRDLIKGNISAGELTSFIVYSVIVASSLGSLGELSSDIQRAFAAFSRLFELMEITPNLLEKENPTLMPIESYPIKFENVCFSYPSRPEHLAISDFSLEINPGEKIALVGSSGAGKSTIFQLLLRFYDPISGNIKINDVDIRDLAFENLRSFFSYVPQEPVIFSTSIIENIAYSKPNATMDEVREAAKNAEILDFIDNLPNGMNNFIGEKGIRISGGQKQRIVIARAILKNPKILLLDEATSNLDVQNERLVQKALDRLMKDRTTIVIAHRLSTIINADKIIVMKEGKIQNMGSHHELMKSNSLYSYMMSLQT